MGRWRATLAVVGILVGGYGVARLLTEIPRTSLIWLAVWLVAALLVHDGVLSPLVVAIGWLARRFVPDRGRRYLQAGLIVAAMIAVIALPLIYRRGSQPPSKAILNQDFGANLALLLGLVALWALLAYAVRVARDRSKPTAPVAPSAGPDHDR